MNLILKNPLLFSILLFSLILRLLFLNFFPELNFPDARAYEAIGKQIFSGELITNHIYMPLYPILTYLSGGGVLKNLVDIFNDNLENIYTSRTFCFLKDVEKIKKLGLAKGGSLENAVVISDKTVLNKGGLRNEKEFVNHKILDLAGDFLLSGYRVIGKIDCVQGGHALSNQFLRKIFKTKNAFTLKQKNEFEFSKAIDKIVSVLSPKKSNLTKPKASTSSLSN